MIERKILAGLSLSALGFIGIVTHEGYTDSAIIPVKGDVPTIGFGTTQGVKMGDKTNPVQALGFALRDIQATEGALAKCVKVPLYQHEYDAYISFAYNVGVGAFCSSTLVKKLNAGDYEGACNQLTRWVCGPAPKDYQQTEEDARTCGTKKPFKRVLKGLQKRRIEERDKCLGVIK